jgi:hypothetical protein
MWNSSLLWALGLPPNINDPSNRSSNASNRHFAKTDLSFSILTCNFVQLSPRRQPHDGKAHLDTVEARLACRAVPILLNRSLSWPQGSRPQPVNQAQRVLKALEKYETMAQRRRATGQGG